ncbi:MAG: hypothetical protein QOF06_1152 [Solirubrobacterales bacterium]|jgi:hypothetical protein|nr:hypothetical protein [Solirubrobacterales bacterium]
MAVALRRLAIGGGICLVLGVTVAAGATVQRNGLRITLLSQVQPYKLPREGTAPVAVFVAGHVATVGGGVPQQLLGLAIRVNRHALLRSRGLPRCVAPEIESSSTERALAACGGALVGSGRFWAHIVLPEQGAYPTQGRLLVFNGRSNGRRALLAHIYTESPFPSSFVIPFAMRALHEGVYGTELVASLPEALGEWGYVDRIKLTLKRRYRRGGHTYSYFNAGCPALPGANTAAFHLAFADFSFAGGRQVGVDVTKACGVRE